MHLLKPFPFPHPTPKPKRLPERNPVTVCIAGINHSGPLPTMITCCDRKISFGGFFSAEGVADKMMALNRQWLLMVAGCVSPMVPIVEAIKEGVNKTRADNVRSFALLCSNLYK